GELDRVGQEVDDAGGDLVGVELEEPEVFGDVERQGEFAVADDRHDLVRDASDQGREVDRGALQPLAEVVGTHHRQRVGDQLRQLPGVVGDPFDERLFLL